MYYHDCPICKEKQRKKDRINASKKLFFNSISPPSKLNPETIYENQFNSKSKTVKSSTETRIY